MHTVNMLGIEFDVTNPISEQAAAFPLTLSLTNLPANGFAEDIPFQLITTNITAESKLALLIGCKLYFYQNLWS